MNIFLLLSVLLNQRRLTNSIDLRCALIIILEKLSLLIKLQSGRDWGLIRDKLGSNWGVIRSDQGENTGSTQ